MSHRIPGLFAFFVLISPFANASCWDASQQIVDNCKVTATSSTTSRALKDRAADVVNVKDFGAKGDGSVNDQPAIAAAIASTNGTVYFPAGLYVINAPIKISKSVTLTGAGSGSVIRAVDCNGTWPHSGNDAPLISIQPTTGAFSDVTVEKLTLDGNCSARTYAGWEWNAGVEVAASGSFAPGNVLLRELHIKDTGGDGVAVRGDPSTTAHSALPTDVSIEANTIERWHANRQGVAVVAGSRVRIAHNNIELGIPSSGVCPASTNSTSDPSNGNFGIDLETNAVDTGDFIAQIQIADNVVHDCNGGINISNSNYPSNAITEVVAHDNTTVAYNGLPLKPLQVTGSGISHYVEFNDRADDGFRIYQDAFKFWSDGTMRSSKGAFLSSTGVWTNASSRDYKRDIQPLTDALSILKGIDVYQYRYREDHGDDGRTHVGVLAEELPDAVASADHKGAPTGELIALSLAANRELLEKVEALQAEIEKLKRSKRQHDSKSGGSDPVTH